MKQELKIDCGEGSDAYKVVLTGRSESVFANAHENPNVIGKTGEERVRAILSLGGIHKILRYKNDLLHDGPNGEPAGQGFNKNDTPSVIINYKNGLRQKMLAFDRCGNLETIAHYNDGHLHDSATEPALQHFNGNNGRLYHVMHFQHGVQVMKDPQGIADYVASRNKTLDTPRSFVGQLTGQFRKALDRVKLRKPQPVSGNTPPSPAIS